MIKRDSKGRFVKGENGKKGFKHSEESKIKMGESHKGKKLSEKTRKRMSESMKGGNSGSFQKGERRSKSTEFKKGIYEGHGFQKGNKPWNYRGITPLNRLLRTKSMWKIWREAVFLRDNFTCQNTNCEFCNNKIGAMLHPHHIKPLSLFPELAFKINNGITYCAEFHLKSGIHKGIQKKLGGKKL